MVEMEDTQALRACPSGCGFNSHCWYWGIGFLYPLNVLLTYGRKDKGKDDYDRKYCIRAGNGFAR